MFHLAENTKLRGIGYNLLNALRVCNVIALLLVAAASWVMVVMTGITSHFFFFDAAAHVFGSSIALFLVLSEMQVVRPLRVYFDRTWPVFSDGHGLFWLGAAMVMLGCDLLGNLNKDAFSVANLGLPLWRLVLAAGVLALVFGVCNCVATFVFRDGPAGLTARMIRADGNLADGGKLGPGVNSADYYGGGSSIGVGGGGGSGPRYLYDKDVDGYSIDQAGGHSGGGFGGIGGVGAGLNNGFKRVTQVFRNNPLAQAMLGHQQQQQHQQQHRPAISMPIPVGGEAANTAAAAAAAADDGSGYHEHDGDMDRILAADAHSTYSGAGSRQSPILPEVRRPPTALHPAMAKRSASGRYSVANMSRF